MHLLPFPGDMKDCQLICEMYTLILNVLVMIKAYDMMPQTWHHTLGSEARLTETFYYKPSDDRCWCNSFFRWYRRCAQLNILMIVYDTGHAWCFVSPPYDVLVKTLFAIHFKSILSLILLKWDFSYHLLLLLCNNWTWMRITHNVLFLQIVNPHNKNRDTPGLAPPAQNFQTSNRRLLSAEPFRGLWWLCMEVLLCWCCAVLASQSSCQWAIRYTVTVLLCLYIYFLLY